MWALGDGKRRREAFASVHPKKDNDVTGGALLCLKKPCPGMARTIYENYSRFMETYNRPCSKVKNVARDNPSKVSLLERSL